MPLQLQGFGGVVPEVDAAFRASRVTPRPEQVLGAFRVAAFSGLTAGLAANTPVFSLRWTDSSNLFLLKYLRVRAAVITGFTAAQELAFDAIAARAFTASDSAGTAITFTGNNAKKRTALATSLVGDCRIAAAVTLTAGTRTLDANPFMVGVGKTLAAAATVQDAAIESVIDFTDGVDYPLVLAQNEGFLVRNTIAQGAGGTVRWGIEAAWNEVASY